MGMGMGAVYLCVVERERGTERQTDGGVREEGARKKDEGRKYPSIKKEKRQGQGWGGEGTWMGYSTYKRGGAGGGTSTRDKVGARC